jgi:hypothetical protein
LARPSGGRIKTRKITELNPHLKRAFSRSTKKLLLIVQGSTIRFAHLSPLLIGLSIPLPWKGRNEPIVSLCAGSMISLRVFFFPVTLLGKAILSVLLSIGLDFDNTHHKKRLRVIS